MSATFYPSTARESAPESERQVFEALRESLGGGAQGGDGWTVIHGACWSAVERNQTASGEADFVLVHPQRGFLVLEVKGGTIRYDPAADRWTSASESGREHDLGAGPVAQANRSRYRFKDFLKERNHGSKLILPHGVGVVFPDLWGAEDLSIPGLAPEFVATGKELGQLGAWAEAALEKWAPEDNRLTAEQGARQARALIDYLAPRLELRPQLAAALARDAAEMRRLSQEQAAVLASFTMPRVLVTGGAGTGKTVLAIEKAIHLARSGVRTLWTCFNRGLAAWVRERIAAILAETGESGLLGDRLVVQSLHEWAVEVTGAQVSDDDEGWRRELPTKLVDWLAEDAARRFDAVLVDEGQDFGDTWWVAIEDLVRAGGHLWVFQDPNQAIYAQPERFPDDLVELPLTRNFRNTRAIHAAFLPYYRGVRLEAAGPDGRAVRRVAAAPGTLAKEVGKLIARLVDEEAVTPEQIAVLSPIRHKSEVVGQDTLGRFRTCAPSAATPGCIAVDTIHGFKGQERPVVILCELDRAYPGTADELHYVGMSRANGHLIVVETDHTKPGARPAPRSR